MTHPLIKYIYTKPQSQLIIDNARIESLYNLKMTIGARIRQLRERNTLSQEKFGDLCGVSKASVSQWEIGIATPPTDRLVALREHLVFSFDWLIAGEIDNNFALTRPSIQKLIAVAQPLPDSAVAALTREGGVYAELISPEKLLKDTK
ncbi:Transcriptional regulator, contains XRE-family HTH domain [Candidatus Nitrotoga sp. HW29]|nr:Transcriptional regulator, contains XRE-family HTH domain [Candidatus Nitrotoga sp. HW29]